MNKRRPALPFILHPSAFSLSSAAWQSQARAGSPAAAAARRTRAHSPGVSRMVTATECRSLAALGGRPGLARAGLFMALF